MKRILTIAFLMSVAWSSWSQPVTPGSLNVSLVSPYDQQVIYTFTPSFFWTFNFTGDNILDYSIKVSELRPDQTYTDAIQFNPPLVFEQGLQQTSFMYPLSAFPLQDDKKYVWQVEATVGGRVKYLSEIWMFQYKKQVQRDTIKNEKDKDYIQYVLMEHEANAAPYLYTDKINFAYNNETRDTLLKYTIRLEGSKHSIKTELKPLKMTSGYNYYSLDMPKELSRNNKKGTRFFLEVNNSRKELQAIKFSIKQK